MATKLKWLKRKHKKKNTKEKDNMKRKSRKGKTVKELILRDDKLLQLTTTVEVL